MCWFKCVCLCASLCVCGCWLKCVSVCMCTYVCLCLCVCMVCVCRWSIMQKCWRYKTKHRPTFMSIIEELVPDLDPNFQNVSYFFSEESHADGENACGGGSAIPPMLDRFDANVDEPEQGDGFLDELDDIDDVAFAGMHSHEESRVPFMEAEDPYHHHHGGAHASSASAPPLPHYTPPHGNRGASSPSPSPSPSSWARGAEASRGPNTAGAGAGGGSVSGSPVECMMLEDLSRHPHPHPHGSPSPPSTSGPSDDSKGSSKSSGSHAHLNGLANGHVYNPSYSQRTKPC